MANLFLATKPLHGWREVLASQQRTRTNFARFVRHLADVRYPAAERTGLVLDQLNIHTPASLYAAFPPAEDKRIADRLEIHHTPRHGSWLNMAELKLAALQRQCPAQHLPDRPTKDREVAAWAARRNAAASAIDWRFITANARTKLKRLYPTFEVGRATRSCNSSGVWLKGFRVSLRQSRIVKPWGALTRG